MTVKFRLLGKDDRHVVKWPVSINVGADGGKIEQQSFTAHFLYLDLDGATKADQTDEQGGHRPLLREVLVGWEGIVDGKGKAVAFSPEARERLLGNVAARVAAYQAWIDCMLGAAPKN